MLGLDISDRSVKIIRLDEKDSYALRAHCWSVVPVGAIENGIVIKPKIVSQVLQEALKVCNIGSGVKDNVVASIAETQSFLRVVEVPLMNEDEIGEAIKWEVSQHIPFGLENVYLDWQPLANAGHQAASGRQEVLVGATQKKVVDNLYQILSGLDMNVAAFELESQAIVRALFSRDLKMSQGMLVVDLGGSATNIIIQDHGTIRFTASLQKGVEKLVSDLEPSDANAINHHLHRLPQSQLDQLSHQLFPVLEGLVTEIKGIVEFYNSIDAQHEVKEIVLTGGGSNLPGLDAVFLRYFDMVHVQRGNPWVNIVSGGKSLKQPLDIKESVRFTTSIGLALRPVLI